MLTATRGKAHGETAADHAKRLHLSRTGPNRKLYGEWRNQPDPCGPARDAPPSDQAGAFNMFNSLLMSSALLGLMLIVKLFPETDVGKWLNKTLVDIPAAWLLKVTAWQVLAIGITIIGVAALVPALPFDMALMAVGDATAYLEVVVAISTIAATVRWKSMLRSANRLAVKLTVNMAPVVRRWGGVFARTARRSLRRPSYQKKGSEDGDGWPLGAVTI